MSTEIATIYVKKGYENYAWTIEDLEAQSELLIGHVFHAVSRYYDKAASAYSRWISYSRNRSEFDILQARVEDCENDLERFDVVCEWLEEPIIR